MTADDGWHYSASHLTDAPLVAVAASAVHHLHDLAGGALSTGHHLIDLYPLLERALTMIDLTNPQQMIDDALKGFVASKFPQFEDSPAKKAAVDKLIEDTVQLLKLEMQGSEPVQKVEAKLETAAEAVATAVASHFPAANGIAQQLLQTIKGQPAVAAQTVTVTAAATA